MNLSEIIVIYLLGFFLAYISIRIFTSVSRRTGSWTVRDRILALIVSSGSWAVLPAYITLSVIAAINRSAFYGGKMDKEVFL